MPMQDSTLISLRKKGRVDLLKEKVNRPASGVPLNALPGWDKVPLYNKLPMLNCPTAAITFTRSKVGEGYFRFQSEFDPKMFPGGTPYNSLHDPALKKYYSRKRNLDHMKKIGKVTPDNYVVCTLKDFNTYRMMLNYVHTYHIRNKLLRMDSENEDRFKVRHAENAAQEDERRQKIRIQFKQFPEYKRERREQLYQERLKFHKQCLIRYNCKLDEIEEKQKIKDNYVLQKKYANAADIDLHLNRGNDIARAKIIKLLKFFRLKDKRFKNHMRRLKQRKESIEIAKSIRHWDAVMLSSKAAREKSQRLLAEQEEDLDIKIKNHMIQTQKKWDKLQEALLKRLSARKPRITSRLKELQVMKKLEKDMFYRSMTDAHGRDSDVLTPLSKGDLDHALHTAVDLESYTERSTNGSIYKAAKYIIEVLLTKINRDLSKDRQAVELVYARLEDFFTVISDGILIKVEQVINQYEQSADLKQFTQELQIRVSKDMQQKSLIRSVSFGDDNAVVLGHSAWEYESEFSSLHLKSVKSRMPTPAGSLTSVVGVIAESEEEAGPVGKRNTLAHCNRDERIFAEHFLIKFKRALIVRVSKVVFDTIAQYNNGQKIETSLELFNLDREYLLSSTAKAILRAGINPFDFESSIRLCTSVLSNDLIIKLQSTVLRPKFNFAEAKPTCKCNKFGICKLTVGNLV